MKYLSINNIPTLTAIVENLIQKDLPEVSTLQPDGWPDIIPHFTFYLNADFCFSIKVKLSDKLIGVGAAIMHKQSAWLAHIIVHSDFRKNGFGSLITQTLIAELHKRHFHTIFLIATKPGEPVYRKAGFEKEVEYVGFAQEEKLEHKVTNVVSFSPHYQENVLRLDREISGENRSRLLIPHLSGSTLVMEKNKITGAYLPTLGEGLIIACSADAGKALIRQKLSQSYKCVLPAENKTGYEFLLALGLKECFRGTRMRLGEPLPYHPEKLYSRIGGNLG